MLNLKLNALLDSKGYSIEKKTLTPKKLEKIKSTLTVTPKVLDVGGENISFKVYSEDDTRLYVPRFYGTKIFGPPQSTKFEENKIDIKFTGKLRDYQENIVDMCHKKLVSDGGGLLCVGCGQGKCLAYDTPVIMYSGDIKPVQDIKVGDYLMGDDSTPRKVLSTIMGEEEMYEITDEFSYKKYTVNKSHILSLKWYHKFKPLKLNNKTYNFNDIIDIPLQEYLRLPQSITYYLKGYRVPLTFTKYQDTYDGELFYNIGYNLEKNKSTLSSYKFLDKKYKYYLLGGLIDKYGKIIYHLNSIFRNVYIGVSLNFLKFSEEQINNIIFIVRSMGLFINKFLTLTIHGKELYYTKQKLLKNKKLEDFCPDISVYDISVKYTKVDKYYGFEIDKNRRFLLGDFTVTHNTVMALKLIAELNVKTLVLVHKTFLQDQWMERCSQFTNAKIGIIRQNKVEVDNVDISIGMVQSITSREYDNNLFDKFSLIVFDEAHRYPSKVFSQAFQKTCPKYIFSLSATPDRADGLTNVLNWFSGDVIFKQLNKPNTQVNVKVFNYNSDDPLFVEKKMWVKKTTLPSHTKMVNNLINIKSRNSHIISILNTLRKNHDRKILVLSSRREHLTEIKNTIDKYIEEDVTNNILTKNQYNTAYYVGGMNKHELQNAADIGDILFGTYEMAQEGLDIDKLNTLILATPKKNIVQAIGRIMRKILKEGDLKPLIIDIADNLSIYTNQAAIREKEYQKNKYKIEHYYLMNEKIETYSYFLKNVLSMSDMEIEEFIKDNKEDNYDPDINKILHLEKVED